MSNDLKLAVQRAMESRGQAGDLTVMPMPGLFLIRSTTPTALEHSVVRPLVCLVLQGSKRVAIGKRVSNYEAGDVMLVTGNVPTASRISVASVAKPYLSLALDLDPAVITDLVVGAAGSDSSNAVRDEYARLPHSEDTDPDLRDALRRLIWLLDRPHSLAVLKGGLIREIHHWLLLGPQGQAIRNLGLPGSHAQRIARAVAMLHADYASPLPVEQLAAAAGMSRSTFHQHFRAATTLSPLQFQKHLRLIEARRLILAKGRALSQAAYDVGYESASQFSREYARMFGRSPAKDKAGASDRLASAGDEHRGADGSNSWKARLRARSPAQ